MTHLAGQALPGLELEPCLCFFLIHFLFLVFRLCPVMVFFFGLNFVWVYLLVSGFRIAIYNGEYGLAFLVDCPILGEIFI